jgi:ABC-type sulfate transport system permease component
MATSFWATVFNVIFGLFAAYVFRVTTFGAQRSHRHDLAAHRDSNCGRRLSRCFALGTIRHARAPADAARRSNHVHAGAIILANIFVTFPLAFGVIKPVFDTMSRSLEEASATIGATRWQTFWHVTLPSLRGAIVSGALLTFARAVGEFGSTILVSGNLAGRTQTAPLYIFAKFNEGQIEAANAIAIVLALFSFLIFSVLFFARDWLDVD